MPSAVMKILWHQMIILIVYSALLFGESD